MSSPKRWYQLSVLQLLVATAVVALFVVKNSSITLTPSSSSNPFSFSMEWGDSSLELGSLQAGWPIPYWHAMGTISQKEVFVAGSPKYRWGALASDVAIAVAAIALAIVVAKRISQRLPFRLSGKT